MKIGDTYGSWTAIKPNGQNKRGSSIWLFRCECGIEKSYPPIDIRNGRSKSCRSCSDKARRVPKKMILTEGEIYGRWTAIKFLRMGPLQIWLCRCECGNSVEVGASQVKKGGTTQCRECANKALGRKGEQHHNWKGGRSIDSDGYVHLSGHGDHPNSYRGSIAEHVLVMSGIVGRPLLPGENVHHKNGVRDDNSPDNLELWITSQPKGQRPGDLVEWAWEIIDRYGKEVIV